MSSTRAGKRVGVPEGGRRRTWRDSPPSSQDWSNSVSQDSRALRSSGAKLAKLCRRVAMSIPSYGRGGLRGPLAVYADLALVADGLEVFSSATGGLRPADPR